MMELASKCLISMCQKIWKVWNRLIWNISEISYKIQKKSFDSFKFHFVVHQTRRRKKLKKKVIIKSLLTCFFVYRTIWSIFEPQKKKQNPPLLVDSTHRYNHRLNFKCIKFSGFFFFPWHFRIRWDTCYNANSNRNSATLETEWRRGWRTTAEWISGVGIK